MATNLSRPGWGAQLAARRKALRLTQYQLADLAGCSHALVVRLEKEGANVSLAKAMAVLTALGLTLEIADRAAGSNE